MPVENMIFFFAFDTVCFWAEDWQIKSYVYSFYFWLL